jgi:ribosome-associated translation inhibitor RaiA
MKLGGNIEIIGFDNLDPGKLVVVKKIVGTHTKTISETPGFKEIVVELKSDTEYEIEVKVKIEDKERKATAKDKNLFFALDSAINKITKS